MKVLYTFYHGSAFAWALVHRLIVHPNDEAYLLLGNGWSWCIGSESMYPYVEKFCKAGLFEKIYLYDNRYGRDGNLFDTLEKTETDILNKMDAVLKKQHCRIEDFDKIYSHTDGEDTMGIYLAMKGKPFYWFETAPNGLSLRTEKELIATYSSSKGYQQALLKYRTLLGESSLQYYLLYPNSNSSRFPTEKCEVFDAESAAKKLDEDTKQKLLSLFGADKIKYSNENVVFMLQSYWFPSQVYNSCEFVRKRYKSHVMYTFSAIQGILDYYTYDDEEIVLKPHPWVVIDENVSNKYFNGIPAFSHMFTVLLTKTLLEDFNPTRKIMLGSTANKQLASSSKDIYCPGMWFYSIFITKYYVALKLLEELGALYSTAGERFASIGQLGNIMHYNDNLLLTDINSLIKKRFTDVNESTQIRYKVIQIKNEISDEVINDNDFIIYTDVWEELGEEQLFKLSKKYYISKVKINKTPYKETDEVLLSLEDEFIYFISKDRSWYEKIIGYEANKHNRFSKVSIGITTSAVCVEVNESKVAIEKNVSLYELYELYGRHFCTKEGNEVSIDGRITDKVLSNMKHIFVLFAGCGNNKVFFSNLESAHEITGKVRIEALNKSTIEIGKLYFSNANVLIHAANANIHIDDEVMFENDVVVRAMNHHSIYENCGKRIENQNINIGKHVWLGYKSTVYGGADIGDGCILNPESVVLHKMPNNCILEGNPASVYRKNVFWQYTSDLRDYYDLPEKYRCADEYICKTEENDVI